MKRVRTCEFVVIGKELLSGVRSDANVRLFSECLTRMNFIVRQARIVGDDDDAILDALRAARAELVIVTGGQGTTRDDKTRAASAKLAEKQLTPNTAARRIIARKLRMRQIAFSERYAAFFLFPTGSEIFDNPAGLALPYSVRRGRSMFLFLPGVPRENESIMRSRAFLDWCKRHFPGSAVKKEISIGTAGLRESQLEDMLIDLPEFSRGEVSILPSPQQVQLVFEDAALVKKIRLRLKENIFSEKGESLEESLIRLLTRRGATLAIAESCTGGMLGALLTSVSGASNVFLGGIISYSNSVKVSQLDVPARRIRRSGAVSIETAELMAQGARKRFGASWGIAVTGIAGPGGGSKSKPVGTVCIAVSGPTGMQSVTRQFIGDRAFVRLSSCRAAMDMLRRMIL